MGAPNLTVTVQPSDSGPANFGQLAAPTSSDDPNGQLSLVLAIKNNGPNDVHLNQVTVSFVGPPNVASEAIAADLTIPASQTKVWFFAPANNIILPVPAPGTLKLALACDGFSDPANVSVSLAPYTSPATGGGYLFPAKTVDLKQTEYWFGRSAGHGAAGGGTQLFAYDMGVQGFDDDTQQWRSALPNTAGTQNDHFRIWGKPIYAMADGTVVQFKNDMDANTTLGTQNPTPNPVEGNHFYIQHGPDLALYAHFQKGTLTPALLSVGAAVTEGQQLGLAGNSGNSSGPHLHIQVNRTTVPWGGPPRPLPFRDMHVLDASVVEPTPWPPNKSQPWSQVTGQDLPNTLSAIWPGNVAEAPFKWWIYVGPLTWAYIIIIGALMIIPGGIGCIKCGPVLTDVLGLVSIGLGVLGFAAQAMLSRTAKAKRVSAPPRQAEHMH
ncbi:MAG: Murein DD-endopeptidase MepM and murein hydrolase activator NlpD, containing LysM domain [Xanthobacteraceae bacterium]|nr:Murein DD-endopeptidase MepM and murein hydrolase activator NlpD, containing LysM domain [Xanthobacteraceae bacterium]